MLGALAHEGRLQILRLCAEAPRSTQELAQLLHLTEAVVSRHLHHLQAAGLVSGRRVSYYVTRLCADRLPGWGGGLFFPMCLM